MSFVIKGEDKKDTELFLVDENGAIHLKARLGDLQKYLLCITADGTISRVTSAQDVGFPTDVCGCVVVK